MAERRTSPRTAISMECTLRRGTGSAIAATTLELGPGGMSVSTQRPLAPDEVLNFALPLISGHVVGGRARVLREQGYRVYALRFESAAAPAGSQAVA